MYVGAISSVFSALAKGQVIWTIAESFEIVLARKENDKEWIERERDKANNLLHDF